MFNTEKISDKIATYFSEQLMLSNEEKEVINYGLFAFLQMIYSFVLVFIIGYLFKVHKEATITVMIISFLRKSAGGVHASTPKSCLIIGSIISILPAIILKLNNYNIKYLIIITVATFIFGYCVIYKKAPVDSSNKPIKSNSKRKRLKRASLRILSYYLIIIFILSIYAQHNNVNYIMSINIGVLWQCFSLTKRGKEFFVKIDKFINFVGGSV